jgi:alpha-beta hydrolase superfamily lysophospholipase
VAAIACAIAAAPAGAAKMVIKGAPAPGPKKYDRVTVWTYGPPNAENVLVLVPGTSGGAGSVAPVARDLARRVEGLQVWAVDRREEAFEDQSVFRRGTLAEIRDYYLDGEYEQPGDVPYVAEWGLATQTRDLRRVVKRAAARGERSVFLGGHSRGASQVAAYAAWDFGGRPGYRDLAGMVLIDGGLLGFIEGDREQPYTRRSAREAVRDAREQPFNDAVGLGIPAVAQIVGQVIGTYALRDPDALSQMQQEPIVFDSLKPDFPVTNEAFLGHVFDADYSPPDFRSLQVNAGTLAESGDPRPWDSGERTPIRRLARALGGVEPDLTEWYYPQRLIIDVSAANPMRRDPPSRELGLRLFHTGRITTPLYAFETNLTGGRVVEGARRLVRRSRIEERRIVRDHGMSHLDPVLAAPRRNTFLKTVVPFLRDLAQR